MSQSIHDVVLKPFRPPFVGLTALIWVYFVACYFLYPDSYVLRGAFIESDNYTYLAQVMDWLKGQGWYDHVQHRLAPPEGTFLHFSRLAEIPLAALTLLFGLTGLPMVGATTLAAMTYPPLLLWGLFWAARWVAESFMPREWTRITAYIVLFSQALLFQFSLGHVGHREPALILTLLSFGCVCRMLVQAEAGKWAAWSGFLFAFSLALALETLPWVMLLSLVIGVWLLVTGKVAVRPALIFAGTLFLSSLFFLAIYRRPAEWLDPQILSYSIVYVVLLGCVSVCCAGVALACLPTKIWLRYAVAAVLAGFSGTLFLGHFPALVTGPYGGMDAELAKIFFTYIPEARPLVASMPLWALFVTLSLVLIAFGASALFTYHAKDDARWLWGTTTLLLGIAIVLTAFYQSRFFRFANLFALLPLAVLLQRGWLAIDVRYHGLDRLVARAALLVAVGPLLGVLVPACINGHLLDVRTALFPMRDVRNACDLLPIEGLLQSPEGFGKKSLRIMNTMSTGPEILFRTQHSVMAAPYHYNARGNLEAVRFFSATDASKAESIARADGIDLVLVCRAAIDIYHARDFAEQNRPTLFRQLVSGTAPAWLHEVRLPYSSNLQLFEVHLDTAK